MFASSAAPNMVEALGPGDWLGLWSSLGGAVIGSIVGGTISYFIARQASKETLSRDGQARIAQEKSDALRATIKVLAMANTLHSIAVSIDQLIADAKAEGHEDAPLWQKMVPISGIPPTDTAIEAVDIYMLIQKEFADHANRVLLLSARYNSAIESLRFYNHRRTELSALMPAQIVGRVGEAARVGISTMSRQQYEALAPRMAELDALAPQIRQDIDDSLSLAVTIASELGPAFRNRFDDDTFPLLNVDRLRERQTETGGNQRECSTVG